MADEWQAVRVELSQRGVAGAHDLGRFVSNTEYFRPSQLDERAAMPVFLDVLPRLSDAKVVAAVAGHLRRPWARPAAFAALHQAFQAWADVDASAGWHIGDAMANAARVEHLPQLLEIVAEPRYGTARQMVVDSLSRFKASPDVQPALIALLSDPDVALHAMGALRRTVGPQAALPHLRRVAAEHDGGPLEQVASRQIRKAEAAIRKQQSG